MGLEATQDIVENSTANRMYILQPIRSHHQPMGIFSKATRSAWWARSTKIGDSPASLSLGVQESNVANQCHKNHKTSPESIQSSPSVITINDLYKPSRYGWCVALGFPHWLKFMSHGGFQGHPVAIKSDDRAQKYHTLHHPVQSK